MKSVGIKLRSNKHYEISWNQVTYKEKLTNDKNLLLKAKKIHLGWMQHRMIFYEYF